MRFNVRVALPISIAVFAAIAACADIGLGPDDPASLQFDPLAAPAVVLGDTLRDINGVATPAVATVRNQAGDILTNVPLLFLYADAARDTAFLVDSTRGYIVSLKALTGTATQGRIAVQAGRGLLAIRTVQVTTRPDSVGRDPASRNDTLFTTLPDTGTGVAANTTSGIQVVVRHNEGTASANVANWLVKFQLEYPLNASNDTTASVFLVDDARKPSTIDTTDASGSASRSIRVRSSRFPTGAAPDSVVVNAIVSYKGAPLKGSPIRVVIPVKKKPAEAATQQR